jgi:hypothetical protein
VECNSKYFAIGFEIADTIADLIIDELIVMAVFTFSAIFKAIVFTS